MDSDYLLWLFLVIVMNGADNEIIRWCGMPKNIYFGKDCEVFGNFFQIFYCRMIFILTFVNFFEKRKK